jgi:hypothetical protein
MPASTSKPADRVAHQRRLWNIVLHGGRPKGDQRRRAHIGEELFLDLFSTLPFAIDVRTEQGQRIEFSLG